MGNMMTSGKASLRRSRAYDFPNNPKITKKMRLEYKNIVKPNWKSEDK